MTSQCTAAAHTATLNKQDRRAVFCVKTP